MTVIERRAQARLAKSRQSRQALIAVLNDLVAVADSCDGCKDALCVVCRYRAALAQEDEPCALVERCVWTREEDDIEGTSWLSACGERWCFNDGFPAENKVKFCHGCGRRLQVAPNGMDLCKCGDYRYEHTGPSASCDACRRMAHMQPFAPCMAFRLNQPSAVEP